MRNHSKILKMVLAALFMALAYVLPFLTGQIPEIGSMLCPMHLPVLLCGFFCGPVWGAAVGAITPIFRSFLTGGFPPLFPTAVCMTFELAAYGAVSGIMHRLLPRRKPYVYCSLVTAMAVGRLVWGTAMLVCLGVGGGFSWSAFLASAFTNAIPGIILQLLLVPLVVMLLDNPKILNLRD